MGGQNTIIILLFYHSRQVLLKFHWLEHVHRALAGFTADLLAGGSCKNGRAGHRNGIAQLVRGRAVRGGQGGRLHSRVDPDRIGHLRVVYQHPQLVSRCLKKG